MWTVPKACVLKTVALLGGDETFWMWGLLAKKLGHWVYALTGRYWGLAPLPLSP
jgi:hypothetical protein